MLLACGCVRGVGAIGGRRVSVRVACAMQRGAWEFCGASATARPHGARLLCMLALKQRAACLCRDVCVTWWVIGSVVVCLVVWWCCANEHAECTAHESAAVY